MSKSINARRVYELTVRAVSVLFSLEVLFSILYFFSIKTNVQDTFREFVFQLFSCAGFAVSIIDSLLIIFAVILVVKDNKFPIGGFFTSLVEVIISIALLFLAGLLNVLMYQGASVSI